jgi:hypothetical protein
MTWTLPISSCPDCVLTSPISIRLLGPDKPELPPQLVHLFQTLETFDWNINDKIHKKLVTRPSLSKEKSPVPARPSLYSKPASPPPNNDIIVAAMDYKADARAKEINPAQPTHWAAKDDLIIVVGTREKRRILNAYKEKFGLGYTDSIVTTKKGKHVNTTSVLPNIRMRPSKDKSY